MIFKLIENSIENLNNLILNRYLSGSKCSTYLQ